MNLIKCNHCGRPFYDSEKACPFCGHATSQSLNNRITKVISDPKSHKLMEDFFAGNLQRPETKPDNNAPVVKKSEPVIQNEPQSVVAEPVAEPEPVVEPETIQPSDAVLDRAETIAAIAADAPVNNADTSDEQPNELETTLPRKKRRWWIWVIILVILLALAAAVYLKWDFVYEKISSLLG